MHECLRCGEPSTRRCNGCNTSKAWYCSQECQKSHWIAHIFECNPRREITTADYLVLAVSRDSRPDDHQTLKDYGFFKASITNNAENLFGLYTILIETLGVNAKKLHSWRIKGILASEIKLAFNAAPGVMQRSQYLWFLKNQWVLNTALTPTMRQLQRAIDESTKNDVKVLEYAGIPGVIGSDSLIQDVEYRRGMFSDWPDYKLNCIRFSIKMIGKNLFPYDDPLWVYFGFCSCPPSSEAEKDNPNEYIMGALYSCLMQFCSFDELCEAFNTSSIGHLFLLHDLNPFKTFPLLADVLEGSPHHFKSVWYLKQAVVRDRFEIPPDNVTTLAVDYGFVNCNENAETMELKQVYKSYLLEKAGDPLTLHEAAMEGRLFRHVGSRVKLSKRMKRLMKNPYSVSDDPDVASSALSALVLA